MLDEKRIAAESEALSLLAVIVLYGLRPSESEAFKTLQMTISHASSCKMYVKVLLYDNTPGGCNPDILPEYAEYEVSQRNAGLAGAYNRALEIAEGEGLEWLLTLDQDTSLPEKFLSRLNEIADSISLNKSIAAIVPQITDNGKVLSPYWFRLGAIPRYYPIGFTGISKQGCFAFNSASTVRVSALRMIGGYNPRFWLDSSDSYLYCQLYRHGKQVYVAGDIQVEHQFSVLDMNRSVSLARYQNILSAGCAFWDLELGWLAGVDFTARLTYRTFYKHWKHGHDPSFRRASWEMLKKRIFHSRKRRIEDWKKETECRLIRLPFDQGAGGAIARPRISVCMAAYNGERYIADQLRSILAQLSDSDEVIVVDDASGDDTIAIVESFRDERIRIFRNLKNQGVAASFERAICEAHGDIIFLSDQDDLWKPNKVRRMMQAFDDPRVMLAQSDANIIGPDGEIIAQSYCETRGGFVPGVMRNIWRCRYLGCTMAFRKQILARCMPFPRNVIMHDVWIGIVNGCFGETAYIQEPLVEYRRHGENVSRSGNPVQRIRWRVNLLINITKVVLRYRLGNV